MGRESELNSSLTPEIENLDKGGETVVHHKGEQDFPMKKSSRGHGKTGEKGKPEPRKDGSRGGGYTW